MGENSHIQWTDHTWNPWVGCRRIRQGCANCYMFREQARYGHNPAEIRRTAAANWRKPVSWDKKAAEREGPTFVFASSWTDFFIDEADLWRAEAWRVMRDTPHLTWLVLTKRIERAYEHLPIDWNFGYPNVLMGVTVEHSDYRETVNTMLLAIPAAGYFVSAEPLLDEIDFTPWLPRLSAVFAGGETGPGARPCFLRYARRLRDDCARFGVPFTWKQWGEFTPYYTAVDEATHELVTRPFPNGGMKRVGAAKAGRALDGVVWDGMPAVAIQAMAGAPVVVAGEQWAAKGETLCHGMD